MTDAPLLAGVDAVLSFHGLCRSAPPQPNDGGSLNDNFRVETDGGPMFVRCHRPELRSRERLEAEGDLTLSAGAAGIPVVPPLGRDCERYWHDGQRFWSVYPWIEGHNLPRGSISEEGATALGEMHARIHVALEAIEPPFLPRSRCLARSPSR